MSAHSPHQHGINRWSTIRISYLDGVVFIIWVGVCLAPIFQEMDLFGVKLKQQIDEFQKDLSHQLSIMKTEIRSSIDISNANQNTISVNTTAEPPRDADIPHLEKMINKILENMDLTTNNHYLPEPDEVAIEMYKVRAAFENLVAKHTQKPRYTVGLIVDSDFNPRRNLTLGRALNDLKKFSDISKDVLSGVSEIISICNYAIHGENLSEKQIEFVRKSSPNLYKALEEEFREHYL